MAREDVETDTNLSLWPVGCRMSIVWTWQQRM